MHSQLERELQKKGIASGALMTGLVVGAVIGYALNHEPTRKKVKSAVNAMQGLAANVSNKTGEMIESSKGNFEKSLDDADKFLDKVEKGVK